MNKRCVTLTLGALVTVALMSAGTVRASENDERAVRVAAADFYTALNVMFTGELTPMKDVWSHRDDVTFKGPGGGIQVGWNEVLAEWKTEAALKLGGKVEAEDMRITVGHDLAVVNNYEIGHNKAADGSFQTVRIRATSVFRKENGQWKMIGHHTDLLPFLQK